MASSDVTIPSLPPPSVPWVDGQGRPTQPFAQYETKLNQSLSTLSSKVSSLGPSSGSASSTSNASSNPKITTKTSNYSLVLADVGNILQMDVASANTVTIPPNSSVAFPVGARITVVQTGAGSTSLVAGSGVTINSENGDTLFSGQYATVTLYQSALNVWVAYGDLVGSIAPATAYVTSGTKSKSVTSGSVTNLASITLPPGNWMIWGSIYTSSGAAAQIVYLAGAIASSGSTLTPINNDVFVKLRPYEATGNDIGAPVGMTRVSLSANTTFYLNVEHLGIGGASNSVQGILSAELVN